VSELSGILPVDKPAGPTSHDVVAAARRALREKRIGHTGTLDPFATGLLLLCLGPATRLAEYLTARPKTYAATMRLGIRTDTDDFTGEPLEVNDGWAQLDEAAIRSALATQMGELDQVPPRYSAKKVLGERAYAAARRGEPVHRDPVPVTVHDLSVVEVDLPEITFQVTCSAGTYIRAIARDVGDALGVGGHLTALRRLRIGEHDVAGALSVDDLEYPDRVKDALITPLDAVSHLPVVHVDEATAARVRHGNAFTAVAPEGLVSVVAGDGALLAIGRSSEGRVQPRKVLG
jgi:tRNA pseudouridine55 synthase